MTTQARVRRSSSSSWASNPLQHAALYREMTQRQLALVQATQRLSDEQAERVRRVL